jgi:hypothetical protein
MHAHPAEVAPESRLHKRPRRRVKRPPRRAQDFADDRRNLALGLSIRWRERDTLQQSLFLLALLALAAHRVSATSAFPLDDGIRQAHCCLGNAVGFLLVAIARRSDGPF